LRKLLPLILITLLTGAGCSSEKRSTITPNVSQPQTASENTELISTPKPGSAMNGSEEPQNEPEEAKGNSTLDEPESGQNEPFLPPSGYWCRLKPGSTDQYLFGQDGSGMPWACGTIEYIKNFMKELNLI
jgi:hypothetical protein